MIIQLPREIIDNIKGNEELNYHGTDIVIGDEFTFQWNLRNSQVKTIFFEQSRASKSIYLKQFFDNNLITVSNVFPEDIVQHLVSYLKNFKISAVDLIKEQLNDYGTFIMEGRNPMLNTICIV